MDYKFLPERIRKELDPLLSGKTPIAVLRSSGSLEGKSGEGYVVALEDQMLMFSKNFGDSDYTRFAGYYDGDLSELAVVNEKFNSFLNVKLADKEYTIKLSSFEVKDCDPIIEKWRQVCAKQDMAVPPPLPMEAIQEARGNQQDSQISPMSGMMAALMFIAATDNEIVQDEEDYIRKICCGNEKYLEEGQKYYNDHTYEELLEALDGLDHQQKLCLLANMLEVAMSDGMFQSEQQRLIKQYIKKVDIVQEEYDTVRDVLMIKNQVSVLVS